MAKGEGVEVEIKRRDQREIDIEDQEALVDIEGQGFQKNKEEEQTGCRRVIDANIRASAQDVLNSTDRGEHSILEEYLRAGS